MSKAIVIQKNGVDQEISVDRLSTPKVGGGRELWIPEDETNTGSVTVEKNGTVNASDAGLYGFHEAIIKVKSVTGKKGGKTYTVTVDDDGYLVYTEDVPVTEVVRIAVTTLPTYTEYGDNAYINYTGIVVHAYDAGGHDLGAIAFEDLIFPVTLAVYDESTAMGEGCMVSFASEDTLGIKPPTIYVETTNNRGSEIGQNSHEQSVYIDSVTGAAGTELRIAQNSEGTLVIASNLAFNFTYTGGMAGRMRGTLYTLNGDDVYYGSNERITNKDLADSGTKDVKNLAWWLWYGSGYVSGEGSPQEIPVQYSNPADGRLLETQFYITVIPAGGHGDD